MESNTDLDALAEEVSHGCMSSRDLPRKTGAKNEYISPLDMPNRRPRRRSISSQTLWLSGAGFFILAIIIFIFGFFVWEGIGPIYSLVPVYIIIPITSIVLSIFAFNQRNKLIRANLLGIAFGLLVSIPLLLFFDLLLEDMWKY